MILDRGSVVLVVLDPTLGHEPRGHRPCVVVSDPEVVHDQHYPMIAVVPLTGTTGVGALYPDLQPGASGLTKTSYALVDQIRSIDKRRVRRAFGRVEPEELRRIEEGLRLFLGLDGETAAGGQPQVVTRRGVETAVVISHAEFEKLSGARATPHATFADSLLALPTSDFGEIERIELTPRDLDP